MEEPSIVIPARLAVKLLKFLEDHVTAARMSGMQEYMSRVGAMHREMKELAITQCTEEELKIAAVAAKFEE